MMADPPEGVCSERVFQRIFATHSKDLYKFLYYKYGRENNPQDLVQDAFIKLWNNCMKVLPEKARAFLFTVANNLMLNELAKKKTALAYSLQKPISHTVESPEYILEGNEYMSRLQRAIEDLSPDQRAAFLLNRIEGMKHQEIAEMLGVSRKTIEKRIYGALAILREKLGEI